MKSKSYYKKEIMQHISSETEMEVEIISNKCCYVCDKSDGIKLTIHEALQNIPVPIKGCKRKSGCNCCIAVVSKRDESGNLIWK